MSEEKLSTLMQFEKDHPEKVMDKFKELKVEELKLKWIAEFRSKYPRLIGTGYAGQYFGEVYLEAKWSAQIEIDFLKEDQKDFDETYLSLKKEYNKALNYIREIEEELLKK